MIRTLAPDELAWFLAQSYRFLGHSDPRGFAQRVLQGLRDAEHEADHAFILIEGNDRPLAGCYVLAPEQDEDDQNLHLSNLWFSYQANDLERLLRQVFARHHYEAVHYKLLNHSGKQIEELKPIFDRLGFRLEGACELDFELSDLPPLGRPLVIEAWNHQTDDAFQELYSRAEAHEVSDETWAWLKRRFGKFSPDLWFIVRETLDQEPVGYAFYGAKKKGIDGIYYLTATGVLQEHRHSTEMLKRVVLSSMHELAARSPLGRLETTISTEDEKLIRIFESLGFDTLSRYQLFTKRP